ncbi:hypothetical protein [Oceanobacillus sp. FSL H7-0719]|uniref:hypothetical protein n=1 Tax=Oceanobacillus sp. FSL H7-0719 TaxID=2954507 RepID=UPI00325445EB
MTVLQKKEEKLINVLEGLGKDDKITIIGMNDFGFPQVSQTRFYSLEVKDNRFQTFIYLIHKPKNKRKYFKKSLDHKDIIILNGWHDVDPDTAAIIKESNEYITREWTSFDSTFLEDVSIIWESDTLYSSINI